ncbi:unnamed protein product, partial [Mesorhabditis spiculigera]
MLNSGEHDALLVTGPDQSCVKKRRQCATAMRSRGLRWPLLILSAILMFAIYQFQTPAQPKNEMSREQFLDIVKERIASPAFRGEYCWKETCFIRRSSESGETNTLANVILVEAALLIPTEYTLENTDTSRWKVDKKFIPKIGYLFSMISAIFATQSLGMTETVAGDILFIGLGGGMNVTMVDINPATKPMAIEQFNVVEDKLSRIIIQDGVQFVKDQLALGNDNIFDAILIDACYNDAKHDMLCPIEFFTEKAFIRNLKSFIRKSGIIVFNLLVIGHKKLKIEKEVRLL